MAYETKDGDISIFPNDKGTNEKRPDYRGTAQLDGIKHKVSLWLRTSQKDGKKFLSGRIEVDQSAPPPAARPPAPTEQPANDEGMPF